MAEKPYLIEMISTLADEGVEFIVCGGMAAVYHGVERMTMDLDISLDMNMENIKRFLEAAEKLNLTPRAPVAAESLLDADKIRFFVEKKNAVVFTFWDKDCPYRQLDVFLAGDQPYHQLKNFAVEAKVDGRSIKVLSLEKLMEMKSKVNPIRNKDRYDIDALQRMKGIRNE